MVKTPGMATTAAVGFAPDERDVVSRAVRGDALAKLRLVAQHHERVARLAYRLLGWRGDIEDLVQDVFVSVLKHLPSFRGESRFTTWLYRITVNECRRMRRKQLLRLTFRIGDFLAARGEAGCEGHASERANVAHGVQAAVRELPRRYREVVVLHYLEGLPAAEIGRILGLRSNAVDVRLNRARSRLRTALVDLLET